MSDTPRTDALDAKLLATFTPLEEWEAEFRALCQALERELTVLQRQLNAADRIADDFSKIIQARDEQISALRGAQ